MNRWMALTLVVALAGCSKNADNNDVNSLVNECPEGETCDDEEKLTVSKVFTGSEEGRVFPGCLFASPLAYEGAGGTEVIAVGGGHVESLDPATGAENWSVDLPVDDGHFVLTIATPAVVGDLLVLEYHTVQDGGFAREQHYVVVIDLSTGTLHPDFERLLVDGTFEGNGLTIPFRQQNALARARLQHAPSGGEHGRVYVTYGNARDIQPWHGFAFELDLDAWKADGPDAAITGQMITTPETDCGVAGNSGSRQRFCGGGLWSPSGPLLVPRGDSYDLILATGNGQLDVERNDFANSLLKVGPGLNFEHGCDMDACANFDSDAPAPECTSSCSNVFIPRDDIGDPFPEPETGICDGMTMFECWGRLDYIGGSTPVHLELASGTEVLAYPTKDGSVYLTDAEHLGTMYDREQLTAICGTADEDCRWDWAGMIVTQPAVAETTERPTILVPTFMPDTSHSAGVVALAIDESSGTPKFERLWTVPATDGESATTRFREHPGRIALQRVGDMEIAWIVEALRRGKARMLAIDVATGRVLIDQETSGSGMRFTQPLIVDDTIWLNHCVQDKDGSLEAFKISQE